MSFANPSFANPNRFQTAFRALALATALGALSLPAAAASVKVNIAGLDAKTAHAHIVRAAQAACSVALTESAVVRYYEMTPCVNDAVAAAEAKYAASEHHYASVQTTGH
jgi:hypothetical protein